MAIDYETLARKLLDRGLISNEKYADYLDDEDDLSDDVLGGATVLSLGWDGHFPGNSGALWVREWKGFYFFSSSDIESEGPFESLDDVLDLEWFTVAASEPELDSKTLPLDKLLSIGKGFVAEEGDRIHINGTLYVLKDGELVAEENEPCL